jgi:glycerol kinase
MADDRLILVLDEGTTSTRAMLYTQAGEWLASDQRDITQHYPQPGWVARSGSEPWPVRGPWWSAPGAQTGLPP